MMQRLGDQKPKPTQRRHEMEVKAFRIACGEFIGFSDIDRKELAKPGMALLPGGYPHAKDMYAARARGRSMEPLIRDKWWCMFHPDVVGSREGRIVLVEDQSKVGGDRYTLKKYHSRKVYLPDGSWEHEEILLLSLNPGYPPIRLDNEGAYRICGWYVGQARRIHRVRQLRYRYVAAE